MESVDVVVATYGNEHLWRPLADRALYSAGNQTHRPNAIQYIHDNLATDLSLCRNTAARDSNADWLIFLDADDELDTHYIEAMLGGSGDLRWPSTLGVVDGREDDYPVLLQPKPSILIGNHMVIGTMVRRELFFAVEGFRAGLPVLEDWDLWIRCLIAGAIAHPCPEAIYRVHVRSSSRNVTPDWQRTYTDIQRRYGSLI